ncbi:putative RTA1 domain protein [Aspergillus steynii IBT 23096]|uniref:Putative RTA1 domain protein n=1 Tax=Aspergillus steynii IBT 23096 TaxID=1392250 RepID=A0A2I2G475_9EURO|nr:putative RTA1 domain protein [Aspergillus steynii IBT 23096]PLB47686.1 putative RTA1 domain protein [Aspergillus steynii IBT 23096]
MPGTPTTNTTLLHNPELCTLDTCPMELANIEYVPNLAGNIFFVAIFGLVLAFQLGFGIKYKTWSYMIAMIGGLALEIIGYVARIQMHYNPFPSDPFLMYLVCLTIGPAFLSAAIYLCLSRIVIAYGEKIPFFRARTYTILFITCDIIALILQAAGGAIASTADDKDTSDIGINIMVAGVSWQVFSLFLFVGLCTDFALRTRRAAAHQFNPFFEGLRQTKPFQGFLLSLGVATLTIITRSVFRCAELSEGFDGKLANDEITFMVLEGAMIAAAVIALTVYHPGWVWKGQWNDAVWSVRSDKGDKGGYKGVVLEGNDESYRIGSNERMVNTAYDGPHA